MMNRKWMMSILLTVLSGVVLIGTACRAAEKDPLENQTSRDSYSLGYEFASNIRRQAVEIDADILLTAIREGLDGKQPALPLAQIQDTLKQLQRKAAVRQDVRFRELAARNLEDGKAFLEANKTKEGVKTLPSGLQYKVLREGSGPVPKASDWVTLHYRGTLIDGKEFDSSYGRGEPSSVPVAGAIKGWVEALQLMKAGSAWQLCVPAGLAYGPRSFGRIPPNSTLIFEIELLSIGKVSDFGAAVTAPEEDGLIEEHDHQAAGRTSPGTSPDGNPSQRKDDPVKGR
jgi:FKBP-type peptidyl-prolyl cis-trans isomerase FklB